MSVIFMNVVIFFILMTFFQVKPQFQEILRLSEENVGECR